MKAICVISVKIFINALEDLLCKLNIDDIAWNEFDTLTDLYLGCNIREAQKDDLENIGSAK